MTDTNFDYDLLLQLAADAPPANCVVARSREEAQALVTWIADNYDDD